MGVRFPCSASCPNISESCLTCSNCSKTELRDLLQRNLISPNEYNGALSKALTREQDALLIEKGELIERLSEIERRLEN